MIDEFLDLLGVAHIDVVHRREIAVGDRAAPAGMQLGGSKLLAFSGMSP
jgi:hypothetical protein